VIALLPANMRAKIDVTDSGCWEWRGAVSSSGYGSAWADQRAQSAHRVTYELLMGPIPEGLQIDHLCRNKICCNPSHLEPVTCRENNLRRPGVHKSHCIHGHELTPENTIVKPRPSGRPIRNCRVCANARRRKAA